MSTSGNPILDSQKITGGFAALQCGKALPGSALPKAFMVGLRLWVRL